MSTIVVFGATGYSGGAIMAEARSRGHHVVAVARDTSGLQAVENLSVEQGSVFDDLFVTRVITGTTERGAVGVSADDPAGPNSGRAQPADVVVVALPAGRKGDQLLADALPRLLEASAATGARLAFVGGAGSLLVSEGGPRLIDVVDPPEIFRDEVVNQAALLDRLRDNETDVDWFYLSPARAFGAYNPGERTGLFRLGGDVALSDADGGSDISGADYAIAFLDEIEHPAHHQQRFSVAY